MVKVQPLGDRVLVKVAETIRKTASGIVLPENLRDQSDRGTVVAVGPGARFEDRRLSIDSISEGDTVIFPPYAGSTIEVDDESFLLLREGDVLGKLDA